METVNLRRDAALKGSSIKRSKKLIKLHKEQNSSYNDSCKSAKSDQEKKSIKRRDNKETVGKVQTKKSVSKPKLFHQSIKLKGSVKGFHKKEPHEKKETQRTSLTLRNQPEKVLDFSHRKSRSLHLPKRKQSANLLG